MRPPTDMSRCSKIFLAMLCQGFGTASCHESNRGFHHYANDFQPVHFRAHLLLSNWFWRTTDISMIEACFVAVIFLTPTSSPLCWHSTPPKSKSQLAISWEPRVSSVVLGLTLRQHTLTDSEINPLKWKLRLKRLMNQISCFILNLWCWRAHNKASTCNCPNI